MTAPIDAAFVALQRFGLGARPGDLAAIGSNPRGAVLAEISPDAALLSGPRLPTTIAALEAQAANRMARRDKRKAAAMPVTGAPATEAEMAGEDGAEAPMTTDAEQMPRGKGGKRRQQQLADADVPNNPLLPELAARMAAATAAPVGFAERWVAFWANHFAVEADSSQPVRWTAGAFEREAIRPNVFGGFGNLLLAVTAHPTMLRYLNNVTSIGPNSRAGQRRGKGLNENHARELLELHTVGVEGGYSQADVTSFARVLTGWSFGQNLQRPRAFGQFAFNANAHEPGVQTVMGQSFAQDGMAQGEAVIAMLAAHPATATHIATKLVRHFVADQPPPELVATLAATFTSSGGDLAAVARALVGADAAWAAPASKVRLPAEYILAATRALGVALKPRQALRALAALGQPLFNPPSPEGFHDDVATWLAPDAMLNRLDVAELMATAADASADARAVAEAILGRTQTAATREAIARAEGPVQGLTILLMSPEFQRR